MTDLVAPKTGEFNDILASARTFRLPGWWSGSAYRSHPCGVHREGLIFTNRWNTHGYCSVDVMLDPTSGFAPRCQNPRAYGNPDLRPAEGGALRVYDTGRWSGDDGPWRAKILRILDDLRDEIQLARESKRLDDSEKREIAADARARKVDRAREVTS